MTTLTQENKPAPTTSRFRYKQRERKSLAYRALVLFSYVYFVRPEDFIHILYHVPLGKITGGIALAALLFGSRPKVRERVPIELKVLFALLVHMLLTIVFASWHGGAYECVVNRFSKGVIIAFLIFMVVDKVDEIKKLLMIQAGSIAVITVISVLLHRTQDGRLMGFQTGILENPNDLAINIAISFPLCFAFLLVGKGALQKAFWGVSMAFMLYAVVATYSRSGLIALIITGMICFWEFVIKGKRMYIIAGLLLVGVLGVGVIVATPSYMTRVKSIFLGNIQGSKDKGSLDARKQLLIKSVKLAFQHPVFGVGPGSFPAISGTWQPAHNTYTGLGAEAGLPAVTLFFLVMALSLHKTKKLTKLPGYKADGDVRLWTGALRAGMAAYMVGAMFATTEYNLYQYFIVGYICVLYKIASKPVDGSAIPPVVDLKERLRKLRHAPREKRELVWSN